LIERCRNWGSGGCMHRIHIKSIDCFNQMEISTFFQINSTPKMGLFQSTGCFNL
jgi:hypothetical protein